MAKTMVLTGGPGAGKTALLALIKGLASEVEVVPETATKIIGLMKGPGFPFPQPDLSDPNNELFLQSSVACMQFISEEQGWHKIVVSGASWLICDRGLADGAAYLSNGDLAAWCATLSDLNFTPQDVLSRYDVVVHLESLAIGDPERYEKIANNNSSRRENVEQAREVEEKIKRAWSGHPNWIFVPSNQDLLSKLLVIGRILKGGQADA